MSAQGIPLKADFRERARINDIPVARLIGFEAKEIADGRATVMLAAGPQHANPMGTLHGGILCDIAVNKKTALITGASDGIGRALAVALAAEGYEITAVARSEDRLKALCNQLGGGSRYLVADLSTETAQDRVAEELTTRHYDVLVNNAGVATSGRLTDVPLAKQVAMVRLNNEAIVKLAYAFLMKAESGDALINTSSTLAFLPMPSLGLYCATKAFVTSFSETLWFEYKDKGIYVMGLCPGPTETNFVVNSGAKEANIPKGMLQTPEQVAKATIKALKAARKPTVISGIKNVVMTFVARAMSRKTIVKMMGAAMKS